MRVWPLYYTLHRHVKCFWGGGDNIKELLISLLVFILDKLQKKKQPQQNIEIVNSIIIQIINKG